MYMNQLTIIGFTGQDAGFHYTPNGTAVTTLSLATKESWKNDNDEWQSRTRLAPRRCIWKTCRVREDPPSFYGHQLCCISTTCS